MTTDTTIDIVIHQTATGWHIESGPPDPAQRFTADLNICDCSSGNKIPAYTPCAGHSHNDWRECRPDSNRCKLPVYRGGYHVPHVANFLKRLAATYPGKVAVPDVPFDASLREGMISR